MLKNYIGTDETDVGKKRRDVLTYFMAGAAMSGFHRPWAGECPEGRWNNCANKMRKVYLSSLEAAGQVATFTSGVEFVERSREPRMVSGKSRKTLHRVLEKGRRERGRKTGARLLSVQSV